MLTKTVTAVLVITLLTGCQRIGHPGHSIADHENAALAAATRLPVAFNRGDCVSLFEGRDTRGNNDDLQRFWLTQCEKMRNTTGGWQSLRQLSASELLKSHPISVLVEGDAIFEKGEYHLEAYWHINEGQPNLYFLSLNTAGQQIYLPAPPHVTPILMDPPSRSRAHS